VSIYKNKREIFLPKATTNLSNPLNFCVILGFLAYLALGKTHEEGIQAGAYCAFECIQQSDCTFPDKPNFDPTTFVI
jgi:hypothetical protein